MSVDLRSANGIARKVQPWLGLREWEVGLSNHTAKSKEGAKQMSQQRVPSKTDTTYRYLHLSAEDLVQRLTVVDNSDTSPTGLTAFSTRRILAFRGVIPSPHF